MRFKIIVVAILGLALAHSFVGYSGERTVKRSDAENVRVKAKVLDMHFDAVMPDQIHIPYVALIHKAYPDAICNKVPPTKVVDPKCNGPTA